MQTTQNTPERTVEPIIGSHVDRAPAFGRFAAVDSPAAISSAAAPGTVPVGNPRGSLSLFHPAPAHEPRRVPTHDATQGAQGEFLGPLVPPVVSVATRDWRVRTDREATTRAGSSEGDRRWIDAEPQAMSGMTTRVITRQSAVSRSVTSLRRRVGVVLFVAAAFAGVSAWAGADRAAGASADVALVEVQVREGDTLQSLALRVAGTADVDEVIALIQDVNGLDVAPTSPLAPHSIVLVPHM